MLTQVLPADVSAIELAAKILRDGGLVAFPTETVYGLGANALDERAVAGIFAAKGRPSHNPLIVHVAQTREAIQLADQWPATAQQLAERFWPGPLTLVVPASAQIPHLVTAGGSTVALRVPSHPVAQALLQATGLPLAAPSANRSSTISPTRAEHVLATLESRIPLILDAGPTPGGLESTVLDLTVDPPTLLRPGLVTPAQIEALIGPILRQPKADQLAKSPGMLARHYAPRTPLVCVPGNGWREVRELVKDGFRVGWLPMSEGENLGQSERMVKLVMPSEAPAYATALYAAFHTLDVSGLDRIVVQEPPMREEWLAVHDRLRRASTRENS